MNHVIFKSNIVLIDKSGKYYPIPVRIKNFVAYGDSPNQGLYPSDSSQFTRRFVLIDTVTGTEAGSIKYVRLPTTIKFWYRLTGESGKMYVPILDIEYTHVAISSIEKTPLDTKFEFSLDYMQDYSKSNSTVMIIFAIFGSFAAIHGFFLTRGWYLRNRGSSDVIDLFVILI
jgi:hypothetical protein